MATGSAFDGQGEGADLARMRELEARLDTYDSWSLTDELGGLFAASGRLDELVLLADGAYGRGYREAFSLLDRWLDTTELLARAVEQLEQRPDADTGWVSGALAELLFRRGQLESLLARGAAGDHFAAMRAADLLIEQQRPDEAIDVLLAQSANGSREEGAGQRAVALMQAAGRSAEALTALCALADAGDWDADEQCARLLVEHGEMGHLRSRADAGSWHARKVLADLAAERGDLGELRERADAGDVLAARRLAETQAANGQEDQLRQRATAGDRAAAECLAELLISREDIDEAVRVLQASADTGNLTAVERLAEVAKSLLR